MQTPLIPTSPISKRVTLAAMSLLAPAVPVNAKPHLSSQDRPYGTLQAADAQSVMRACCKLQMMF